MPKLPTENTGAAAALKWLSEQVASGEKELARLKDDLNRAIDDERNNPPEKDGADFGRIRAIARQNYDDAFKSHMNLLSKLQMFDKTVDVSKRDASESITRADGEKIFSMMAITMRTAMEAFKTRVVPEIRESKTNEDGYNVFAKSFDESMIEAIKSAIAEGHIPSWARDSVEAIL